VIKTKRLILRTPLLSDAEAIFRTYAADDRVTRYLTWTPHRSVEGVKDFICSVLKELESGQILNWVILRTKDKTLLGNIGVRLVETFMVEVGYVLGQAYWRQGYMSEALGAVIDFIFQSRPKIERIQAFCDYENPASARVMEKCEMRREGLLRHFIICPNISDKARDAYLYSIIREDKSGTRLKVSLSLF